MRMRTYNVKVFLQSMEIDEMSIEATSSYDAEQQAIDETATQIEATAELDEDSE